MSNRRRPRTPGLPLSEPRPTRTRLGLLPHIADPAAPTVDELDAWSSLDGLVLDASPVDLVASTRALQDANASVLDLCHGQGIFAGPCPASIHVPWCLTAVGGLHR